MSYAYQAALSEERRAVGVFFDLADDVHGKLRLMRKAEALNAWTGLRFASDSARMFEQPHTGIEISRKLARLYRNAALIYKLEEACNQYRHVF